MRFFLLIICRREGMASKELFIFKTFYPLELKTESLKVHKSISRIKLSAIHCIYI